MGSRTRSSAEGAKVAVTSRSTERAEAVAGEIGGCGYAFDANDLDSVAGLIEAVEDDLGPIDIYIANTGGPPAGDPLSFSRDDWASAQRTLLLTPIEIIQRVLPGMRERGFGRVVAIGSMAVSEPIDAHSALQRAPPRSRGGVQGPRPPVRERRRDASITSTPAGSRPTG